MLHRGYAAASGSDLSGWTAPHPRSGAHFRTDPRTGVAPYLVIMTITLPCLRGRCITSLIGLLAVGAGSAAAQGPFHGTVVDDRTNLPLADVLLRHGDARPRTDRAGRFIVQAHEGEWIVAMRIGYRRDSIRVGRAGHAVIRLHPAPPTLASIVASASASRAAGPTRELGELDLALRPHDSAQELLRLVPGLVVAQHGGGGKAEQIFLRGFDADHGTDVAISVDGTPVNVVSHAHGQGYADLHFLLPEVVERLDVRKGPFDVRDGNLATAGAVAFHTRDRIDRGWAELRRGSFGTASGRVMIPFGGGAGDAGGYVAAAVTRSDGPFIAPQNHARSNVFARFTAPVGAGIEMVATGSAFDASWYGSGQVPERAVRAGQLSRFGSIDSTEGGSTSRAELALALRSSRPGFDWQARAYAVDYRFALYSNFTFFLRDSIGGDGIAQQDARTIVGLQLDGSRAHRVLGLPGHTTVLAGIRRDDAQLRLSEQTERQVGADRLASAVIETHLFGGAEHDFEIGSRVRLGTSLRADVIRAVVQDQTVGGAAEGRPSGARTGMIVSPRLTATVDGGRGVSVHGHLGTGFHSNDSRDVVQAGRGSVIPRAVGVELGLRKTWDAATVAVATWLLDLESELVFVGDEGVTEAAGRTRRIGVDLEARVRVLPVIWFDADINLSRGRLRDEPTGMNRIPLAPALTATAGITIRDTGPVHASWRVRRIGARPADEGATIVARGSTLNDVSAGWRGGRIEVAAGIDNLFDVDWNEAQFATTSRLRNELAPVTELHFTPGSRRAIQVSVRVTH